MRSEYMDDFCCEICVNNISDDDDVCKCKLDGQEHCIDSICMRFEQ